MKSRIFISYSRKDYGVVIQLRNEIHRCTGVLPWMDVSGIETGSQFADVIAKAIDACELLVFVISPNSVESPWTLKEVLYAQEQRKKIYPVVIHDARLPRKLAFLFADVDRVDLQDAVQCNKFFSDLVAFCGERALGKARPRKIPDAAAVRPQLPPEESQDECRPNFFQEHKDILMGILVMLLVGVVVGVPVYIITSRFVAKWFY